jgi:hypothetical protein
MEDMSPESRLRAVRKAIAAGQVVAGADDAQVSYWLDRYAMIVAGGLDGEAPAPGRRKRSRQTA